MKWVENGDVRYWVRRSATSKASTSWSGSISSQSETLVMQELRKRHPGAEIELIDIKWG
jgi:hypothetical protein